MEIGLEFALLYPERANHLVLVNGAHGQVFHSALQPIVRLPIVHDVARTAMSYAATRPKILRTFQKLALPLIPIVVRLYVWLLGSRLLKQCKIFGDRYVERTLLDLLNHLCQDEKTMETYLWLFQELNAHSVYHLLGSIQQQTLLVSGLFDLLLPAYHMWEMERSMPHATHVCDCWSTHFTLLEHPEVVLLNLDLMFARWELLESSAGEKPIEAGPAGGRNAVSPIEEEEEATACASAEARHLKQEPSCTEIAVTHAKVVPAHMKGPTSSCKDEWTCRHRCVSVKC